MNVDRESESEKVLNTVRAKVNIKWHTKFSSVYDLRFVCVPNYGLESLVVNKEFGVLLDKHH